MRFVNIPPGIRNNAAFDRKTGEAPVSSFCSYLFEIVLNSQIWNQREELRPYLSILSEKFAGRWEAKWGDGPVENGKVTKVCTGRDHILDEGSCVELTDAEHEALSKAVRSPELTTFLQNSGQTVWMQPFADAILNATSVDPSAKKE